MSEINQNWSKVIVNDKSGNPNREETLKSLDQYLSSPEVKQAIQARETGRNQMSKAIDGVLADNATLKAIPTPTLISLAITRVDTNPAVYTFLEERGKEVLKLEGYKTAKGSVGGGIINKHYVEQK